VDDALSVSAVRLFLRSKENDDASVEYRMQTFISTLSSSRFTCTCMFDT